MDYRSKKRLVYNPVQKERYFSDMYQRFEQSRFPPPEIDLKKEETFFGNPTHVAPKLGYDQFFSYTKVHPIFDQRKPRENRGSMADKWENIHQQEKPPKPVPATTSQWYGRRPCYDIDIKIFAHKDQIGTFFFKSGATKMDAAPTYTDEPANIRL